MGRFTMSRCHPAGQIDGVFDASLPLRATKGKDRLQAALGCSGILSALFLVTATVLGVWLRDDVDHVVTTISELYQTGAPHAAPLMVLFTAYHALVIPLALGLYLALPRGRLDWLGPVLLATAGAFGVPLGAYARCDPGCFGATTFRGQLHGILVLVTVPLIFAAMFATWRRTAGHARWRTYGRYTLVTAVVGLAFGAGMSPFVQGPYAGLLERIAVAIMLQWYVVTGIAVMREGRGGRGKSSAAVVGGTRGKSSRAAAPRGA